MLIQHLEELKFRFFYFISSLFLSSSIAFYFLPSLLKFSPLFFLNHKWEDALFTFIILAFLIGFISCFPLFLFHLFMFLIPALYPKEKHKLTIVLLFISTSVFIYWTCAPFIIFSLPTFYLSYHTDTLLLTPLLQDFLEIIEDYFLCTIFIIIYPYLIYKKVSRKFLYLFAILFSSIFGDIITIITIFIPLSIYIEISFFIVLAEDLKASSSEVEHSIDNVAVIGSIPLWLKRFVA